MTMKLLKRIAAVVLAVSIVLSFALVNVSAATGGNLIDRIPTGVDINSGEVGCAVSGNTVTLTANSTVGTSSDWGMQGFEINEKFISTISDGHAPIFSEPTEVIISAKVRKAADATADAKINVSYASWYNVGYEDGTPQYTDTYPNVGDGFLVNSTEWMNFKAVITVPASTDGNTWAYLFGLSSGTAQGAKVEVDMSSMYFGPEFKMAPSDLVDYTPAGDGNLVTTHGNDVSINSGDVSCPVVDKIVTLTANTTVSENASWGINGFEIDEKFIPTLANGYAPVFPQETKVLISAKVRKTADSTVDPKINVSYSSWYATAYEGWNIKYTDTYPNVGDGFAVTSTDWMDFKAVITVPARTDGNTWSYLFGMASGTAAGAKVEVDLESIYFGAEIPYDIEVTATNTSATAKIVNQVGEAYSGGQGGFSWYALNADRTAEVDGIEVSDNGDGTAAISIADTVAGGKYNIIAVSDTYDGFIKGAEIKVVNLKNDYTPVADGNIVDTYPVSVAVDINSGEVGCAISDTTVTLTANSAVGTSSDWGMQGFELNEKFISTLSDGHVPVYDEGTKVLFRAKVRKAADATQDAKINISLSSWYKVAYESGSPIYTDTYPTVGDGFLVNSTDWVDFTAVMTMPNVGDGNTWAWLLGLANGTAQGAKVEVDMTSIYIGTEAAYDIKVAATSDTTVAAEIVNQIGTKFSGAQGGFTWKAMNADRSAEVDGITVSDNGNGTATITVADTVASGKYNIVAISDTYDGFIKGVEITVDSEITGITLAQNGGVVTVATDRALNNEYLIFVSYENDQMIDYEIVYVTLDAQGRDDYAPVDLTQGEYTKAMLWDDMTDCAPLASMIKY